MPELLARAAEAGATDFRIDEAALTPRKALVAGREVVEAVFTFSTSNGPGIGALRLLGAPDGLAKAWFISTTLDFDKICEARAGRQAATSHARDFAAPDWLEQRVASRAYSDREPDVLVVGGGHAGISAAVELKRIGLDVLVIDREESRRRQLASSLSRPQAAQQDAGQSSALSAVPGDLSGLHPEGPDRQLSRKLRRPHGGRFLDPNEF